MDAPSKSILIAEDEKIIANLTAKAFKRAGFEVHLSYDGIETIEKALELHPDVILLDIEMPKADGIEVLKKLRGKGSPCIDTPIIAISAYVKLHDKRRAMEAGATEYLCKPMLTEDMITEVKKCLKKQIE